MPKGHEFKGLRYTNQRKNTPDLFSIGCAGKITSFNETDDGRYIIVIKGINRFKILQEVNNNKPYRECEVSFDEYNQDMIKDYNKINFTDLKLIFKNIKSFFKKKGYTINWNDSTVWSRPYEIYRLKKT